MRRLLLLAFLLGPFATSSEAGGKGKIPTDSEEEFFEKLWEHLLNEQSAPATVEVRLPPAAELFFDGAATTQRGPVRRFITPPLEAGWTYAYKVTARWQSPEGKPINESRDVTVRAGQLTKVDFFPPKKDKDKKEKDAGFVKLFNGKDLSGWRVPEGDNGHWKVLEGVIDYDAKSEAKGDKCLWTEKSFKDFVLRIDWRLKPDPGFKNKVPIILPDGNNKKDDKGKEIRVEIEDVDSGIYLRGRADAQVNIWMWPVGSGEVWGYRTNPKMPAAVRAACTPKKKMDRPRGEWNTFEITMKGDRLWVKLNGEEVIANAQLPGVPREGPIALQHHGGWNAETEQWSGPPSLVQFRFVYIKELTD